METLDKYLDVVGIELIPAPEPNTEVSALIGRDYEIVRIEPMKHMLQFEATFLLSHRYYGHDVGKITAKAGATLSDVPYDSAELAAKAVQIARTLENYVQKVFRQIAPPMGYSPDMATGDVLDSQLFTAPQRQNDGIIPPNFNVHGTITEGN